MAYLKITDGNNKSRTVEVKGSQFLMGRHPNCQVVLDHQAVSRYHAQILQSHGRYYLEDLRSRNKTYLNGEPCEGRVELQENDTIIVCDSKIQFLEDLLESAGSTDDGKGTAAAEKREGSQAGKGTGGRGGTYQKLNAMKQSDPSINIEPDFDSPLETEEKSSIVASRKLTNDEDTLHVNINPEAKLRAILEINKILGEHHELTLSLEKILEGLFRVFPQADEGFFMLKDPFRERLLVKASHFRYPAKDKSNSRPSMTIIKSALQSREAVLSTDTRQDVRFDSAESVSGMEIQSTMCVPLYSKQKLLLGAIQINTTNIAQHFTHDDLDLLISVCSQAILAIEYSKLLKEMMAQQDVQKDLEFATQVQLGFLPNKRPTVEGYNFGDYYEAAQNVGGDYFDYVTLPDGKIVFALADVAGKGVSAALLMARLYSAVRFHVLSCPTAAEAMTKLNEEISQCGLGHRFITCVIGFLDPSTHEVAIANAGHMSPLIRSQQGSPETIPRELSGMPLGIMNNQVFPEAKLQLSPGDLILIYTDGVTESMDQNNDLFGSKRLTAFLSQCGADSNTTVQKLLLEVEKYSGEVGQKDDICILALQRNIESTNNKSS